MSATAAATYGPGVHQARRALAIEHEIKRDRSGEDHHEIFRPQRAADRDTKKRPPMQAAGLQRAEICQTGQRPERKLNDVVIEFHRREIEIMHAVDDQHRDERAGRADDRQRRHIDKSKTRADDELGEEIIGEVAPDQPVDDLDHPPGQRRQLVMAQLPFAPIDQRLDQIERKIGIEDGRNGRPDDRVQQTECREGLAWIVRDPCAQSGTQSRLAVDRMGHDRSWMGLGFCSMMAGSFRQACVVRRARGQCSAGWRIKATPPSAWVSRCCA